MTQHWPQPQDPREKIAKAVHSEVVAGGRVESHSDYNAVVVHGKKPNHVLHLILTIFTCFIWSPVWIILALVQKERRVMLSLDPYGNLVRQVRA